MARYSVRRSGESTRPGVYPWTLGCHQRICDAQACLLSGPATTVTRRRTAPAATPVRAPGMTTIRPAPAFTSSRMTSRPSHALHALPEVSTRSIPILPTTWRGNRASINLARESWRSFWFLSPSSTSYHRPRPVGRNAVWLQRVRHGRRSHETQHRGRATRSRTGPRGHGGDGTAGGHLTRASRASMGWAEQQSKARWKLTLQCSPAAACSAPVVSSSISPFSRSACVRPPSINCGSSVLLGSMNDQAGRDKGTAAPMSQARSPNAEGP